MANLKLSDSDARTVAGIAYFAVRAAEYVINGAKKGSERMEWCIDKIYGILPAAIKAFVTRDMLQEFIQQAWSQMVNSLEAVAQ